MSTNDRSEESSTMDSAESAPAADTTPIVQAAGTTDATPPAEATPAAVATSQAGAAPADAAEGPVEAAVPAPQTAAATAVPAPEPIVARGPGTPAYRQGPAVGTVLLGLLCVAVAVFAYADRVLNLTVDWARVGPLAILVGGAVLVLLGMLGMRRRRGD
jgi:hypothetical protein